MNITIPVELVDCTIDDLAMALRNPETDTVRIRIEIGETDLTFGEYEREAIGFSKYLRSGLTPDGWRLLFHAACFDGPFTAADLAGALGLDDPAEIRHRMRAIGRTGAYKAVRGQVNEDVPVRSRRVDGETEYWVNEWWRRAILRVDEGR